MALLAAAAGLLFMGAVVSGEEQRRQRRRGKRAEVIMSRSSEIKEGVLSLLAIVALASLLLALFAFLQPTTRTISEDVTYEQSGVFSYSAAAPPGLYDANMVRTGEPIFRQFANSVAVNFAYRTQYTLAVVLTVLIKGNLIPDADERLELHDEFSPRLVFRLDRQQMYLIKEDPRVPIR